MARVLRVVLDVATQPDHEIIDGPRIGVFAQTPYFLQHRLARDWLSLMLYQVLKQIRFHQSQGKYLPPHAQFELSEVNRLVAEAKRILRRGGSLHRRP